MTYTSSETGNLGTGIMPRADTGSDLYFYKFSNVSINKQDRISLPVFETVLPFTDAYYCKIVGMNFIKFYDYLFKKLRKIE